MTEIGRRGDSVQGLDLVSQRGEKNKEDRSRHRVSCRLATPADCGVHWVLREELVLRAQELEGWLVTAGQGAGSMPTGGIPSSVGTALGASQVL